MMNPSARSSPEAVVSQMQALVNRWEQNADQRAIFLGCYLMMTKHMYLALQQGDFHDSEWVRILVAHFADYYFRGLKAYELKPTAAPPVWRLAHEMTQSRAPTALQKLLLGVNAHINYDLVLTLVDLLEPDWSDMVFDQRARRYEDYCQVNAVIGRTIDAVQDQILEPAMPFMDLFDKLLGRMDEFLISSLITRWRETVWRFTVQILETAPLSERTRIMQACEAEALRIGRTICLNTIPAWMSGLR